jgi:hypothetical protein
LDVLRDQCDGGYLRSLDRSALGPQPSAAVQPLCNPRMGATGGAATNPFFVSVVPHDHCWLPRGMGRAAYVAGGQGRVELTQPCQAAAQIPPMSVPDPRGSVHVVDAAGSPRYAGRNRLPCPRVDGGWSAIPHRCPPTPWVCTPRMGSSEPGWVLGTVTIRVLVKPWRSPGQAVVSAGHSIVSRKLCQTEHGSDIVGASQN